MVEMSGEAQGLCGIMSTNIHEQEMNSGEHTAASASAIIFLDFSFSLFNSAASWISAVRSRKFSTFKTWI
jgi:hypothetical protein